MVNEDKLKLFGLLAENPELDLRKLVQRFNVSIHKLKRWKKEYLESLENKSIETLTELEEEVRNGIIDEKVSKIPDKLVLDEAKEQIKRDLIEELVIDQETNEIVSPSELERRQLERLEQTELQKAISNEIKSGLNGITDLKAATYDTALCIVEIINKRVGLIAARDDTMFDLIEDRSVKALPTYTRDLVELSQAICNIQNAFFNKPITNVSVTSENVGILADFRSSLTD